MNRDDWNLYRLGLRYALGLETAEAVQAGAPSTPGRTFERILMLEGLGPLFHWLAAETGLEVHPELRRTLDDQAHRHRDHLVRVNLAAAETLRLLRRWEIPAMVVKGLSLAGAWPHPMLRTMSDVDVLIRWEDRDRLWDRYDALHRIKEKLGVTAEVEPCHHDLDLGRTVPFDFPRIFDRRVPARIAGEETHVAGPEDQLLFTASSALRKDLRSTRLILDALFLLRVPTLDFDRAWEDARALGLDRALHLMLRWAAVHLQAPVPASIRPMGTRAEAFLGLDRPGPVPHPRALPGRKRSGWVLRGLTESPGRLLSQAWQSLLPPPIALRNQNRRFGRHRQPLPLLYLRHWGGRIRSLLD